MANIIQKRHHTAETSRQSFIKFNETKQRANEHKRVYDCICVHQPLTSRKLSILTGIERGNITRTLHDAVNTMDPLIKIVFDRPCPITGRPVHWYSLIEYEAENLPEIKSHVVDVA